MKPLDHRNALMVRSNETLSRRFPKPPAFLSAFTLIEVIVALLVMGAGMLAVLKLFQTGLEATVPIEDTTRGAMLAESLLAGLQADPSHFPLMPPPMPDTGTLQNEIKTSGQPVIDGNPAVFPDIFPKQPPYPYRKNVSDDGLPLRFSFPGNCADDDPVEVRKEYDDNLDGVPDALVAAFPTAYFPPTPTPLPANLRKDFDGGPEPLRGLVEYYDLFGKDFQFINTSFPSIKAMAFKTVSEDTWVNYDFNNEPGFQPNELDLDGDFIPDDNGDSYVLYRYLDNSIPPFPHPLYPDGDPAYDPMPFYDEEFADGMDNDGDGYVDEDVILPSVFIGDHILFQLQNPPYNFTPSMDNSYAWRPLLAGDGINNDGDVDPNTNQVLVDEEIYNNYDDDNDGKTDEDCELARMPFWPMPFPPPYQRYAWQIFVGRVAQGGLAGTVFNTADRKLSLQDLSADPLKAGTFYAKCRELLMGDGLDNDGDDGPYDESGQGILWNQRPDKSIDAANNALDDDLRGPEDEHGDGPGDGIDEERFDGIDNDLDGRTDEDVCQHPVKDLRYVVVRITWGGDGIDNDGDGATDEEAKDGSDVGPYNDHDDDGSGNSVDEDCYEQAYEIHGYVVIP